MLSKYLLNEWITELYRKCLHMTLWRWTLSLWEQSSRPLPHSVSTSCFTQVPDYYLDLWAFLLNKALPILWNTRDHSSWHRSLSLAPVPAKNIFFQRNGKLSKRVSIYIKNRKFYLYNGFPCFFFFFLSAIDFLSFLFEKTSEAKSHKWNCKIFPFHFLEKKITYIRKTRGEDTIRYFTFAVWKLLPLQTVCFQY